MLSLTSNITQLPTLVEPSHLVPLNDSATLYMHTVDAFPKNSEELVDHVKEETCLHYNNNQGNDLPSRHFSTCTTLSSIETRPRNSILLHAKYQNNERSSTTLLLVTLKLKNMVSLSSGEGSQGQFSEQGVNPSRLLHQECL
ncbi:hypothetical protein BC941DRAFT_519300 [Chlamydoabsidia padenii]|nr:hypothetical protein BC941DRAFT_519300 [Chlamydoabsidia padenii]